MARDLRTMSDTDQPPLPEWGPGKTAMGRARLPSSRRRDRPTLSCNLCRRRKLRCDRQQPCATCAHRGLDLSCSYAYGPNARSNLGDDVPAPPSPATVQDRIKQLELLVVDLMQKTSATDSTYKPRLTPTSLLAANESAESTCNPATDDSLDRFTPDADHGSMRLTMSGTSYVHGAHWTAVLDGIAELKDHFEREDEAQPERRSTEHLVTDWTGPQLLYGFTKLATREEILASIPARTVVDRLVSRYFNSFDMSPAVLHSVQFLKEYHAFWEDASGTSTIWLGLLFSVMCLATQFQRFQLDPHDQPSAMSVEQDLGDMVDSFRQRIVQCLILGNYAKGGRYVLETLLLYMTVELFLRSDAEIGIWMLLGTIVQLAMHMGYHRDPKHFRRISPFDGEMRKRVWATVVEVQLGVSMQMGLPRLISQWQTDTSEPSNLQDSDFNMDTVVMPPSRPETDLTPMIYRVVKARMMMTIGYIWDFAAGTGSYTYADVFKMEQTLQDAHASIPECLAWRSMADCITDSPHIIMQKVYLEILFHRARIVLHRRCLHLSPSKLQYSHSQGSYLDAALRLLEYQHMLWEETQPPCQLYQERWKVSSLVNHDFLLATSVLCLYLKQSSRQGHMNSEAPTVGTIWASLERSYDIWLQSSGTSKEAAKAAKALRVVLLRPGPGIDDSTPLGRDSSSSSIAASDFGERFGGHYDVDFDTAMMGDWPFPTGEPIGSSFVTLSTSPGVGWQMADGAEMTSS